MDQVSFCAIQDTSLPSEQLPSSVSRAEKSPVHLPCACGALAMSPHLPACPRWQWAISIVSACSPARPAGSLGCWGWQSLWDFALHLWEQVVPIVHYKDTTSLFFTLPLQSLLPLANPEWLPSSHLTCSGTEEGQLRDNYLSWRMKCSPSVRAWPLIATAIHRFGWNQKVELWLQTSVAKMYPTEHFTC